MEIYKLSRINLFAVGLMLIFITSCSLANPFVDRRREAGRPPENLYIGMSKPDAPLICYNPLVTDEEALQKMADEECQKHKSGLRAVEEQRESFVCRILTPNYVKYKCVKE